MLRDIHKNIFGISIILLNIQVGFAQSDMAKISNRQVGYSAFNIILLIAVIVMILAAMVVRIITNKELQERELNRRLEARKTEDIEEELLKKFREQQEESIGRMDGQTQPEKRVENIAKSEIKQTTVQANLTRDANKQTDVQVKVKTPMDVIIEAQQSNRIPHADEEDDIVPKSISEIKPDVHQKVNVDEGISITDSSSEDKKDKVESKDEKPSLLDSVISSYNKGGLGDETQEQEDVVPGSASDMIDTKVSDIKQDSNNKDNSEEDSEDDPFIDLEPENIEEFFGYTLNWQLSAAAELNKQNSQLNINEPKDSHIDEEDTEEIQAENEVSEAIEQYESFKDQVGEENKTEIREPDIESSIDDTEEERIAEEEVNEAMKEYLREDSADTTSQISTQDTIKIDKDDSAKTHEDTDEIISTTSIENKNQDESVDGEEESSDIQKEIKQHQFDSHIDDSLDEIDSKDKIDHKQILMGAKTAQDIMNAFQPRKGKKRHK